MSLSERNGTDSPFDGVDVGLHSSGLYSSVHAVDWNKDGYMDLLVWQPSGIRYFQGGANDRLSEQTNMTNPFAHIAWEAPEGHVHAVDWDNDGHLDLLLMESDSYAYAPLRFFRGGANGSLEEQMGAANPFTGLAGWPHVVDWDGDGRRDLLLGFVDGVRFFRAGADGSLSEQTSVVNAAAFTLLSPQAVDWDGDGRVDLLGRTSGGLPRFFRRGDDGSVSEEFGPTSPLAGIPTVGTAQAVDWDGDGWLDLLTFNGEEGVRFWQGGVDDSLREQTGSANPFVHLFNDGNTAAPQAVDWDGDGCTDLIVSSREFGPTYFRGGCDGSVSLHVDWVVGSPLVAGIGTHAFQAVDWDGDGRLDVLQPRPDSTVDFFSFTPDGKLFRPWGADNPFEGIRASQAFFTLALQAVDWDGDGLLDLLVADVGALRFFRGGADGSLSEQTGSANPFAAIEIDPSHRAFHAVDWDGDSRTDLLLGNDDGTVRFFLGGAGAGVSEQTGSANPFAAIDMGYRSWPGVVDWDGDGRKDLLVGTYGGAVRYFSAQCDSTALGQRAVCSSAGSCEPVFGRCQCLASNEHPEATDCSLCASLFYKERDKPQCQPCPGWGTNQGPCLRRGTCWDTRAAREALREGAWVPAQRQAPGNGTCACEAPFFGHDCGEGECPAGSELAVESRANSSTEYPVWETCAACAAGQYKAAPAEAQCGPCAAGTYQSASGATACDPCPSGMKQSSSGSSHCDACEGGSVPNALQTACEACSPGRRASPGQGSCSVCEAGLVPTPDRSGCQPCDPGSAPSENQTSCEVCPAGRSASPGQGSCSVCQAGLVPADDRGSCKQCDSGQFVAEGEWACRNCPLFYRAESGSSSCWLHEAVVPSLLCLLFVIVAVSLRRLLRRRQRRAITLAMQRSSAPKLREALERGSRLGLGGSTMQPAQRYLQVLERKYVDYEYLLKIVEEGDLKFVKGTWLADERNGQRLRCQQDLPEEAFWAVSDLRSQLRAVLFVAVSYCWLHEVHPDPNGVHLRTLRHAIRLRLGFQGPGQIVDIALFLDYCSLAQHGERGDPACPERGEFRTPEQQASFSRGLRQVNIPYANQSVEVWMMQWVPDSEDRKYMTRGWPFFEQAVAALIKDSPQLLLILPELQRCQNWLELHRVAVARRRPPLTPAQFNEQLDHKTFTSPGTDKALVIKKYNETFHDVLGYAATLWFSSLDWHDEDAVQLAQVLPHCKSLEQLFLGLNCITAEGAAALAKAARACPVRGMDLSGNLIEECEEEGLQRLWQGSGKGADLLRMGRALAKSDSNTDLIAV